MSITAEDREQFHKLGDVNRDGSIDGKDLAIIEEAYGSSPGHPKWNPEADLNNDGRVNIYDVVICSNKQGLTIEVWKAAIAGIPPVIIPTLPLPPAPTPPEAPPAIPAQVIPPTVIPVPTPPVIAPPPIQIPAAPTIPIEIILGLAGGGILLIAGLAYLFYSGGLKLG